MDRTMEASASSVVVGAAQHGIARADLRGARAGSRPVKSEGFVAVKSDSEKVERPGAGRKNRA
jgi:hypothetical protein